MTYTRSFFGVARGGDGRLYAVGGYAVDTESPPVGPVEAYTPSTNTWTTVSSLPNPRGELSVASGGDGRVYAIGGYDAAICDLCSSTEVDAYDTSTDTWTTVAPLPVGVADAAVATSHGKIYVFGGYNGEGNPYILDTVQIYNPRTNSWTSGTRTPSIRDGATAVTGPDGDIYVIGGYSRRANISGIVKMYSPSTDSWTTKAPMPTARWFLAGALGKDGKIYAIGGSLTNADIGVSTVEAYDPSTNTWATAPSLQVARSSLGAGSLGGRIYAVGGETRPTATNAVEYLRTVP
jgi:N-acetylneuraminic acid mutarotase